MKKKIRSLLFLFFATNSIAQTNNIGLEHRLSPDTAHLKELWLDFHNLNYLRNYEYFNKTADGFTLFGSQLKPSINYFSHKNLLISAGLFIRKDFGDPGLHDVQPLYSVKYVNNGFSLICGTLEGNIHHRILDPLFDFDRIITNPIEYGSQFIFDKKHFYLDTWIDWEKMIYKPSPIQEKILGGLSSSFKMINKDRLLIEIPLQAIITHQGGQIDSPDHILKTFINSTIGIKVQYLTNRFIRRLETEDYILSYKDNSQQKTEPYIQGNGLFLNAGIHSKYMGLVVSYWEGNGYQALKGAPIYQSVSQHINYTGLTEDNRKLLFFRFISQYQLLDNLYLDVRFEPLIDLKDPHFDFSNSLFLVYKDHFRLRKKTNYPE